MARSSQSGTQRHRSLVRWTFWSTLVVCAQLLLMVEQTQAARTLPQPQRRLQAYRDSTNTPRHAPAIKSFLVSDGSWVDCIPIEGQIAAHHPALKDHIIQMPAPSSCGSKYHHPQRFASEHGGCPEGSIPVLRTDPFQYAPPKTGTPMSTLAAKQAVVDDAIHEHAVTGVPEVTLPSYTGTRTIMSVNGPELEDPSRDFSLSQLWIVDGQTSDNTLSTIEVGWQKFPRIHRNLNDGDPNAPHLFIYWTNDNYQARFTNGPGSCYNLLNCAGFIQTNSKWVIGGAMPSYTTLAQNASREFEVEIEVLYNPTDSNWHLYLNKDTVGYWPTSLFKGRHAGAAAAVQWGGEVVFYKNASTTSHSKTAMGSGAFQSAGYPRAAYHRNVTYANAAGALVSPRVAELITSRTRAACYNIAIAANAGNVFFYYGGPGGRAPACAPLV